MAKSEEKKETVEKATSKKTITKKTTIKKNVNSNNINKGKSLEEKEKKKKNIIEKDHINTNKKNGKEISEAKKVVEAKEKILNQVGFKTSEVVFLVIITCIISIIMGFVVCYSLNDRNNFYTSNKHIKSFIDTYENIIDNYYEEVDENKLIQGAISGMLNTLDDHYSELIDQNNSQTFNRTLQGEYEGLGIEVTLNNNNEIELTNIFEDSGAAKADLKIGDIVLSIDGKSMKNLSTNDLVQHIDGNKKNYKMTILRNGEKIEKNIEYGKVILKAVSSRLIEKNGKKIGYISIEIFSQVADEQFKEKLNDLESQKIDSLIIDVRNNTGGHLTTAINIISNFLDKNTVIYQTEKKGEITKFYSNQKSKRKYPIVILQNNCSASASELLSSALKEQYGATIVGTTSYGKGTIQELILLGNNSEYKYTTKKWLTSKGEWINEKGISPDVNVELSSAYISNPTQENDNQLNEAIKILIEK